MGDDGKGERKIGRMGFLVERGTKNQFPKFGEKKMGVKRSRWKMTHLHTHLYYVSAYIYIYIYILDVLMVVLIYKFIIIRKKNYFL